MCTSPAQAQGFGGAMNIFLSLQLFMHGVYVPCRGVSNFQKSGIIVGEDDTKKQAEVKWVQHLSAAAAAVQLHYFTTPRLQNFLVVSFV